MHTHTHTYPHTRTHAQTHMQTYTYMHIHMRTCMHTRMQMQAHMHMPASGSSVVPFFPHPCTMCTIPQHRSSPRHWTLDAQVKAVLRCKAMLPVQGRAAVKAKQWHAVQGCAVAQAPGRIAVRQCSAIRQQLTVSQCAYGSARLQNSCRTTSSSHAHVLLVLVLASPTLPRATASDLRIFCRSPGHPSDTCDPTPRLHPKPSK